ncbi:MAG TPA: hypothetical protein VKR06_37475 [Ktedonosporobacter sp.]|nr:hypothetical protein [Ktedonosporobacter sp.]
MSRGLDAEPPVSAISLRGTSLPGDAMVFAAFHRERVRKAVAAFFSTSHSLDTLVAQLVGHTLLPTAPLAVIFCNSQRALLFKFETVELSPPKHEKKKAH